MAIGVVLVVLVACLYPSFYIQGGHGYKEGNRVSYNMIPTSTLCLLAFFYIYYYRYNYLRLREHFMVLWNLPDGGPSHSGPLLGPSESLRGGTLSTNPHQQPLSAWQVSRC
jgi:hypothetical protein